MQKMLDLLEEQSLEKDAETLEKFYHSVKVRASGVYFGETDHLIPWQTDHLICWRTNSSNAIVALTKVVI